MSTAARPALHMVSKAPEPVRLWRALRDEPFARSGAALALFAAAIALQAFQPLNHDVAWLLVGAQRLLDGAPLYHADFLDVNPPFVLALFAPAVAAARALHVPPIVALRVWLFALGIGSLLLCHRLALRALAHEPTRLARAWLVALVFALLVLPDRDFGQREHLIVLLLLPYLIDACVRAEGGTLPRGLAMTIGAGAGVAAAMKPQFALVVAVAEAPVWAARRGRRAFAELGAFAGVVAVAAAGVAWLYPDYYAVAIPLAAETYGAYQSPIASLVRGRDLALLGAVGLAAAWLARDSALRRLARTCAGASAASWIAYLVGGTAWNYHRYPFQAFATATLGLAFARLLVRPAATPRRPRSFAAGLGIGATAFAFTAGLLLASPGRIGETLRRGAAWRADPQSGRVAEIVEVAARRGHGGAIWLPATSVDPAFPAVDYAGVAWASRLSCLWPLPAVIQARAGRANAIDPERHARLDAIARFVVAVVVEDLERAKPELILVSRTPESLGLRGLTFDPLRFLASKPGFAEIWKHYAWVEDTRNYRVFARREPDSAALTTDR